MLDGEQYDKAVEALAKNPHLDAKVDTPRPEDGDYTACFDFNVSAARNDMPSIASSALKGAGIIRLDAGRSGIRLTEHEPPMQTERSDRRDNRYFIGLVTTGRGINQYVANFDANSLLAGLDPLVSPDPNDALEQAFLLEGPDRIGA
jgi:hypothetical protein